MKSAKKIGLCVLLLLIPGLLSCSGSLFRNYGRILPAAGEARDLENGVVNPELRYYISGADVYPNALMGLNRSHRLNPETLWREVAMTPQKLREITGFMKSKSLLEYGQSPHELSLLDPAGREIGFWYSLLPEATFVRIEEDGTVVIPTPDPYTYEKLRPRGVED